MHKIVLFYEEDDENDETSLSATPLKIGNLFLNRFAIDEKANYEIVKIFKSKYNLYRLHWEDESEGVDQISLLGLFICIS